MAGVEVFMLVESARVSFGRIIKQKASSAVSDFVYDIDREIRARFETSSVDIGISLYVWIHDLSCSDLAN